MASFIGNFTSKFIFVGRKLIVLEEKLFIVN